MDFVEAAETEAAELALVVAEHQSVAESDLSVAESD